MVIVIQGVSSQGWAVPPFIIVAGKNHLASWYENSGFPANWVIAVTENGWTTNERGMNWIQHFEKHTKSRTIGGYRLLVLAGHESHHSDEFEEYRTARNKRRKDYGLQLIDTAIRSVVPQNKGDRSDISYVPFYINYYDKAPKIIAGRKRRSLPQPQVAFSNLTEAKVWPRRLPAKPGFA